MGGGPSQHRTTKVIGEVDPSDDRFGDRQEEVPTPQDELAREQRRIDDYEEDSRPADRPLPEAHRAVLDRAREQAQAAGVSDADEVTEGDEEEEEEEEEEREGEKENVAASAETEQSAEHGTQSAPAWASDPNLGPPGPERLPDGGQPSDDDDDGADVDADEGDDSPVSPPRVATDVDGPTEFARTVYHDRAVAARHRTDHGDEATLTNAVDPLDASETAIGGIDGYTHDALAEANPIGQEVSVTGVSEDWMARGTIDSAADINADHVYITYYTDRDDVVPDLASRDDTATPPTARRKHTQMAVYAYTDAMGIRCPDHAYSQRYDYVAVEDVGTYGPSPRTVFELSDAAIADNVDPEEFVDHVAVQLLGGNSDLTPGNIMVDEMGGIHTFDYDMGGFAAENEVNYKLKTANALETADRIDEIATEGFDVTQADILRRVHEIAVSLEETGHVEEVMDAVAAYDEVFRDETGHSYAPQIGRNIAAAAEATDFSDLSL